MSISYVPELHYPSNFAVTVNTGDTTNVVGATEWEHSTINIRHQGLGGPWYEVDPGDGALTKLQIRGNASKYGSVNIYDDSVVEIRGASVLGLITIFASNFDLAAPPLLQIEAGLDDWTLDGAALDLSSSNQEYSPNVPLEFNRIYTFAGSGKSGNTPLSVQMRILPFLAPGEAIGYGSRAPDYFVRIKMP